MTNFASPVRCLLAIVDRGKGEQAAAVCRAHQAGVQLVLLGRGTASAEIMDYLGLDEPEKDVLLSLTTSAHTPALMADLTRQLELYRPGKGIAFTIDLCCISAGAHPPAAGMGKFELHAEREADSMPDTIQHELIIAVVEHGFAPDVMDAARAAGARGGTLVRGRGLNGEEAQRFLKITIQPEKDVVLILVPSSGRQPVMKAICAEVFTRTGEHGVAFSLPVSDVTGLSLAPFQPEEE